MRTVVMCALAACVWTGCGSDDSTGDDVSADDAPTTSEAPSAAPSSDTSTTEVESGSEQMFPDVIDAEARRVGDTWTISATLSSPYDSPERYADAWRVVGPDGAVYAERILTHDHATEQPFTRSQSGVVIPEDVTDVVIEGRDLEFGYGGDTFELTLPE
jgi:hypothetical protein